jgi:cellulose synthase/poly-beta-1,6-N-acetylglucosamine synthase-like glycosyltransferase
LYEGLKFRPKRSYEVSGELPKFSLIVPVKDEEVVVGRCLTSLLEIDYPREKMEILVVDGASKDSTCKVCQEFAEKNPGIVRVIGEAVSHGKPAALNFALAQVTGEIVGVFDADSIPERAVLRKVLSYFQDKSVSAVQGSTCPLNVKQNMLTRVVSMEEKAWFQGLLGGREKLNLFIPLTGSCQFIRTDILKELGGWEESALAEDVELSLKLTEKKHLVKYAPDIVSGQESPGTLRGLISQRTRWYRGYMEASFKYGSLLKSPSRKVLDAELSLAGPFVMIVCLLSYFLWGFTALFSLDTNLFPISAILVVGLTSFTLLSLGFSLVLLMKPVQFKNILWIPFIFIYWFLQMGIAGRAFLQILFRRRRVWKKTDKAGIVTPTSASARLTD